jgi:hypothetical protein
LKPSWWAEDVLTIDRCCFSAKKVWISFFHSLFSLFFVVFSFLNYWHRFLRSPIAGINFNSLASIHYSLIHSQPSHLMYVSLARFLHQFMSFFFYNSISTSAKKMRTLLFAVFNVNRWWTLECCYHDSVCVWFDAY